MDLFNNFSYTPPAQNNEHGKSFIGRPSFIGKGEIAKRLGRPLIHTTPYEIESAQELVDTLKNVGDRLAVVGFYSPACGACKTLHPKICQLAESNPGAIFLKVNHEELKKMCHALHIHVLPFFKFYKGSQGHLCSFSCTVSIIKKFKNALAKHSNSELQSSLDVGGKSKGLNETELYNLASVGEISMSRIDAGAFIDFS